MSLFTNPCGLGQAIGAEKESLLLELQQLNESTNNAVAQLQEENKNLSRDINDLDKQLHDVANEKTLLMHGVEKERVKNFRLFLLLRNVLPFHSISIVLLQLEKKASLQNKLLEVQQEHKRHIELVQNQHSKVVQEMQKDMAQQLAKLQEQLNKRESEKQQQLAQGNNVCLVPFFSISNVFTSRCSSRRTKSTPG